MFSHIYLDSSTPDLSSHFTNPISVYSRSIPGFPCFPPSNHYLLIHQSSLAIYQVQFSSVQFTKLTPTYSLGFNLDAILSKTSSLTKSSNFPNLDCVLFVCFSSSLHNFVKLTACSCMLSFVQVFATPRTIACHAVIPWLIIYWSRDWSCRRHVAIMHWSLGWSYTDHVTDHALIICLNTGENYFREPFPGRIFTLSSIILQRSGQGWRETKAVFISSLQQWSELVLKVFLKEHWK